MNFIQYWKAYFTAIIGVGVFFIIWDVFFAMQEIWGFNNDYLIGIRYLHLPIEEWFFFLLIPYSSNFIHYALLHFYPNFALNKKQTQIISISLFALSFVVFICNLDKSYTAASFGIFASLMLFQVIFNWKYARTFYLSFLIIYVPFFMVNSILTGRFTPEPIVYYNNTENLSIRIGTMPVEDTFYCFALLYASVILFEYLKTQKFFQSNPT